MFGIVKGQILDAITTNGQIRIYFLTVASDAFACLMHSTRMQQGRTLGRATSDAQCKHEPNSNSRAFLSLNFLPLPSLPLAFNDMPSDMPTPTCLAVTFVTSVSTPHCTNLFRAFGPWKHSPKSGFRDVRLLVQHTVLINTLLKRQQLYAETTYH